MQLLFGKESSLNSNSVCGMSEVGSHSSDHPLPLPPSLKGVNFPPEGKGDQKNKGGSMVQGQVSRFIILTFRNCFTLCKIVLCI